MTTLTPSALPQLHFTAAAHDYEATVKGMRMICQWRMTEAELRSYITGHLPTKIQRHGIVVTLQDNPSLTPSLSDDIEGNDYLIIEIPAYFRNVPAVDIADYMKGEIEKIYQSAKVETEKMESRGPVVFEDTDSCFEYPALSAEEERELLDAINDPNFPEPFS